MVSIRTRVKRVTHGGDGVVWGAQVSLRTRVKRVTEHVTIEDVLIEFRSAPA